MADGKAHQKSGLPQGNDNRDGIVYSILVALVLFVGVGSMLYATRHWWMPPVADVTGVKVDSLFTVLLVVTGITFVLVHVLMALFVFLYRARQGTKAAYWFENMTLELSWTLIPAAILIALTLAGGVLWVGMNGSIPALAAETSTHTTQSTAPDHVVVEVTGQRFAWTFRYPGDDGKFGPLDPKLESTDNRLGVNRNDSAGKDDIVSDALVLPSDRDVVFEIKSKDVIHSFFVPAFRRKQDAVPGRTIRIEVHTTREGDYEIACAELCGTGHWAMHSTMKIISQDAFNQWLQEHAPGQGGK